MGKKRSIWFLLAWLLAVFTAGCLPVSTPPPVERSDPTSQVSTLELATGAAPVSATEIPPPIATAQISEEKIEIMPTKPPIPTPNNPSAQRWISQAKEDLAGRLNLRTDEIDLVEFEMVVWPDGSLGCPQPGMAYTQVQVEGYFIRLQANQVLFAYHGDAYTLPFLCANSVKGEVDAITPLPGTGLGDD